MSIVKRIFLLVCLVLVGGYALNTPYGWTGRLFVHFLFGGGEEMVVRVKDLCHTAQRTRMLPPPAKGVMLDYTEYPSFEEDGYEVMITRGTAWQYAVGSFTCYSEPKGEEIGYDLYDFKYQGLNTNKHYSLKQCLYGAWYEYKLTGHIPDPDHTVGCLPKAGIGTPFRVSIRK